MQGDLVTQSLNLRKDHWWCWEKHPVLIVPVPQINNSLARFKSSYIRASHWGSDYKLAWAWV